MAGGGVKMFGTPPEPLFNNTICGASREMVEDWLSFLMEENNKHVENAKPEVGTCFLKESVEFLFYICERMKMSAEVKYLSVEIFDRFMCKHIHDLYQHVLNTSSKKTQRTDWQNIKRRVTNQVILRVVSCVQIASKLTSHYRVLRPRKAREFLHETGHKYGNESILQSELRILKTLDFKVSVPSPLLFMETLLEMLGYSNKDADIKVLHGVTQSLLDLTYLSYHEIYDRLQKIALEGSPITEKQRFFWITDHVNVTMPFLIDYRKLPRGVTLTEKQREKFCSVRADKMLLMASLITAATYIVDRPNHEQVIIDLCNITNIPQEDITDLASVLLKLIMESSED